MITTNDDHKKIQILAICTPFLATTSGQQVIEAAKLYFKKPGRKEH